MIERIRSRARFPRRGGCRRPPRSRRPATRPRGAPGRPARRATRLHSRTRPGARGSSVPARAAPCGLARPAPGCRSGARGGIRRPASRASAASAPRRRLPPARIGVGEQLDVALAEGRAPARAARRWRRRKPGGAQSTSRAIRSQVCPRWSTRSTASSGNDTESSRSVSRRAGQRADRPPGTVCRRRRTGPATASDAEALEHRLVAAPSRPRLHLQLEEDRVAEQRARSPAVRASRSRLTIEPPLPTTICFCDSVSTKIVARTTFSSSSSTSTEIACGTSSRVSWSAFSRTARRSAPRAAGRCAASRGK